MRSLKFLHPTDDVTSDAHQHALNLEAELGLSLMNKDAANPNLVHGYVNTSGDGTVEVFLYEEEDLPRFAAHKAKHEGVPLVAHAITDEHLKTKAAVWKKKHGFIDHPSHEGEIKKVDTSHYGAIVEPEPAKKSLIDRLLGR